MISKNSPIFEYSDYNIGGVTVQSNSYVDINTHIAPLKPNFQVLSIYSPWLFISNFWTGPDGNVMISLTNPMNFDVTEVADAHIRILWL